MIKKVLNLALPLIAAINLLLIPFIAIINCFADRGAGLNGESRGWVKTLPEAQAAVNRLNLPFRGSWLTVKLAQNYPDADFPQFAVRSIKAMTYTMFDRAGNEGYELELMISDGQVGQYHIDKIDGYLLAVDARSNIQLNDAPVSQVPYVRGEPMDEEPNIIETSLQEVRTTEHNRFFRQTQDGLPPKDPRSLALNQLNLPIGKEGLISLSYSLRVDFPELDCSSIAVASTREVTYEGIYTPMGKDFMSGTFVTGITHYRGHEINLTSANGPIRYYISQGGVLSDKVINLAQV